MDEIQLRIKNKTRHYLESEHILRRMIYLYFCQDESASMRKFHLKFLTPFIFNHIHLYLFNSPNPMAMLLDLVVF